MKYSKPVSLGRLRRLYSTCTGIYAWFPILRGREYKREALDILRKNNVRLMLRDVREWLDNAEKELL